MSYVQIEI